MDRVVLISSASFPMDYNLRDLTRFERVGRLVRLEFTGPGERESALVLRMPVFGAVFLDAVRINAGVLSSSRFCAWQPQTTVGTLSRVNPLFAEDPLPG